MPVSPLDNDGSGIIGKENVKAVGPPRTEWPRVGVERIVGTLENHRDAAPRYHKVRMLVVIVSIRRIDRFIGFLLPEDGTAKLIERWARWEWRGGSLCSHEHAAEPCVL